MHYAELSIYETIYPVNSDASSSTAQPDATTTVGFQRLECHWRSLESIKAWFGILLSMPPPFLIGFSFPFWAQGMRCLVTLFRLSTCPDPSWDRQAVRSTVDLLTMLDQIAEFIDRARAEIGETADDSISALMSRVVKKFREWAVVRLEPSAQPGKALDSSSMNTISAGFSVPGFYGENVDSIDEVNPNETEMLMQWFLSAGNDPWLGGSFQ